MAVTQLLGKKAKLMKEVAKWKELYEKEKERADREKARADRLLVEITNLQAQLIAAGVQVAGAGYKRWLEGADEGRGMLEAPNKRLRCATGATAATSAAAAVGGGADAPSHAELRELVHAELAGDVEVDEDLTALMVNAA
jgi:hypothetical protein